MKYLMTMFLFAALLAGCSAVTNLENTKQAASPVGNRDIVNATKGPIVEATMKAPTSVLKSMVITVRPPMIPVAPVQGPPAPLQGWQTLTSSALEAAVDYPVDWSVIENDEGVEFTSPQGVIILLKVDKSKSSPSTARQDCVILINRYGQAGDICFDAATFSYSAVFKKPADEKTPWLVLSMVSREKPAVFYQMFDSFRLLP